MRKLGQKTYQIAYASLRKTGKLIKIETKRGLL